MRHKSVQVLSIGVLSAMLLAGCSSSTTGTTDSASTPAATVSSETTSSAPTQTADTATYGQITTIEGSTITVELGTKKEMNKGGGQGEKRPEGTAPSGQPEMPNDQNNETPPSGQPEAPEGSDNANAQKKENFSMLDLTGETKTITVTDATTITIQSRGESSTGALSDLQVGSTISFELSDDDSTATAITLQSMGQRGNGQGDKNKGADSSPSASETPAS